MTAKTWTQADREQAREIARGWLADLEGMSDHFIADNYASADEHRAERNEAFDLYWTLCHILSTDAEVAAAIAATNARWA